MEPLLQGRSAIVTGAGRGIGRGIALCLARDGADVAVADLNETDAATTAKELQAMGRKAVAVAADAGTKKGAGELFTTALKAFGKIDILVNNAGVIGAAGWEERAEPNDDDWALALKVNLMSRVYCCGAAVPHMKERRYGKIVNIASIAALRGARGLPHYGASKAADVSYTQSLALDLAGYNINVNAVLPGSVVTPMTDRLRDRNINVIPAAAGFTAEELKRRHIRDIPLGRYQTPEDIGNAVAFLASDRAASITGQFLTVDGGMKLR